MDDQHISLTFCLVYISNLSIRCQTNILSLTVVQHLYNQNLELSLENTAVASFTDDTLSNTEQVRHVGNY